MNIPNRIGIYSKKYPVIIVEGKKEDVAKQLKQRFEYDGPFIDRVLGVDPTKYKYVEYIANKLEKIIPELAGPNGGLNVQQGEALQDLFGIIIPWFHANVNRITETGFCYFLAKILIFLGFECPFFAKLRKNV